MYKENPVKADKNITTSLSSLKGRAFPERKRL